jgi:hypothetical protein
MTLYGTIFEIVVARSVATKQSSDKTWYNISVLNG